VLELAHNLQSGLEKVVAAVAGSTAAYSAVTAQDFVAAAVAHRDCFDACRVVVVAEGRSADVAPATFVLGMGCRSWKVMPLAQKDLCRAFAGFAAAQAVAEEELQWHPRRQRDCWTTLLRR
jgi:hypothetical protein